ncbi:hypothetical protein ACNSO8_10655 [Yersinia sp. LJYL362]|uniref:hypothetical protein n=1 Tax=Yersinia sp. LJYL362 TaxID=3402108 RepID=UPI003AB6C275
MSFNISNRVAVIFTKLSGGNISTKRANRIAAKLESVKNIPKIITNALMKKHNAHPELGINFKLAQFEIKKSESILESGIKSQHMKIEEKEELISNFGKKRAELVNSIYCGNTNTNVRLAIGITLEKRFKIDFTTNREIENNIADLRYRSSQSIDDEKILLNNMISQCHKQIAENTRNIITVIIDVARKNQSILSSASKQALQEYDDLVKAYKSAPDFIEEKETYIDKLEIMKGNVSAEADQIEHLQVIHTATQVIKETNEVLSTVQESNAQLADSVKAIMVPELQKSAQINAAILGENKTDGKTADVEEQSISFPDVPQHKPKNKPQNNPKVKVLQ